VDAFGFVNEERDDPAGAWSYIDEWNYRRVVRPAAS
jgi:hypothetical protein